jgi:hypothetical protein
MNDEKCECGFSPVDNIEKFKVLICETCFYGKEIKVETTAECKICGEIFFREHE